jgi:FkbM family methyltransferase
VGSLRQDAFILSLRLPLGTRLRLVASKHVAVLASVTGHKGTIVVGQARIGVSLREIRNVLSNVGNQVRDWGTLELPAAPVVVDVGANIGQFCAAAKLLWPDAQVLSIEADPGTALRLAENVGTLQGVSTLGVGVGTEKADLPWFKHQQSALSTFRPRLEDRAGDACTVHVESLDALTAEFGTIDLLKVDVEGFEYEVIVGAPETLRRSRWLLLEAGLAGERSGLELLSLLHISVPTARIARVGRSYSACVDLLIDLHPTSHPH